ncbi:rhomboid family intramembrane serine protease [Alcanivorax sp. 1008]|uniref:rhomboid family intramembrane serine protease n=1 Tax=Alcanivorax sp. 1008 TaxID=2816853 RepID=UPI001DDB8E1D|nr:rhomboid family intramembrane serine protease [Alcanivorax sp. 1008]MCC1496535.1 rhomboid family intramembrane serine protease [Alcanivorax sp. 1008]
MIPKPATETTGLKSAPWVCLGFFIAYLLIHLTLQHDELERQQDMADWYQQSGLFELEWENYISWLRISGQISKAETLEQARGNGDSITVFRAMAFDPAFEAENQLRGDQYWDYQQMEKWRGMRDAFRERSSELPGVKAGLNPSAPRPSTYLTWHFLHENLWIWMVALLVAMPFAWPVEKELGHGKTAVLWIVTGVVSGLIYVAFLSSRYLPLTGSTPMAAGLIGMYVGLFGLRKLDFLWFDPRQKKIRSTALPAAVITPLFFILPVYETLSGGSAAHVWVAQIGALLAGAGLVHLARQAEVRGAEQQVDETDDSERQLRQKLTSAWASMSAMAFRDAEQQFEAAMQMDPNQFLPLTGLYQIRKLTPESDSFHQTARQVLDADISDEGLLRQQYNIYRDYVKRLDSDEQIPLETRVRLIANLSKLGETKEADRLATVIEKQGDRHPMLGKSLSLLAQALSNSNQARSNHLKMLAVRLTEESV